jgi:hypothetical protein
MKRTFYPEQSRRAIYGTTYISEMDRLREHLGRQAGTLLNPRYLSQLMAREGIVYRRLKHLMAHLRDPKDYNEKKAILEFLKNARSKGTPASPLSTLTNVKFTCTRP